MKTKHASLLLILLLLIGQSLSALAQTYTLHVMTNFTAHSMNNNGEVIGSYTNGIVVYDPSGPSYSSPIPTSYSQYRLSIDPTANLVSNTYGSYINNGWHINDSGLVAGYGDALFQSYTNPCDPSDITYEVYDSGIKNDLNSLTNPSTDVGANVTGYYTWDANTFSSANGINAAGNVVVHVAEYYDFQVYLNTSPMPYTRTNSDNARYPHSVNDEDQITGWTAHFDSSSYAFRSSRAFLWNAPSTNSADAIELPTLTPGLGGDNPDYSAYGVDINNGGVVIGMSGLEYEVCGSFWTADFQPFVWEPSSPNGTSGTITQLPSLMGGTAVVTAINDSNVIVGFQGSTAVKWTKSMGTWSITDISGIHAGLTFTRAIDINSNGSILGVGTISSVSRNVLLIP